MHSTLNNLPKNTLCKTIHTGNIYSLNHLLESDYVSEWRSSAVNSLKYYLPTTFNIHNVVNTEVCILPSS